MFISAAFLWAAAGVAASPLASHILQHSRSSAPTGFTHVGSAAPGQTISFRVALKANNASGLEARHASLSNPSSPEYGQWLSADAIIAHLQPSQESIAAFNAFASANGLQVTVAAGHGEWMSLTTNVSHANTLFAASFQNFQHKSAAEPIVRTLSYSLPSTLADHVDTVYPTTSFEFSAPRARTSQASTRRTRARRQASSSAQSCSTLITPSCLQTMYNIPPRAANASGVSILITGYAGIAPQLADNEQFLATFRPDVEPAPFDVLSLDGGTDEQAVSDQFNEANFDVQYAMGVAGGIPTSFLTVGGLTTQDETGLASDQQFATGLFDTTTYLTTTANPPTVVTTSYGFQEEHLSPQVVQKICAGYMAAGARGISIITASMDNGVHEQDEANSCSNDIFSPMFPATCPYVTAVGSTRGVPETAAAFSGGGFSTVFARPAYQDAPVSGYLSTIPATFAGIFSRDNRAFPDVALQGVNMEVIQGGNLVGASGTSGSAPAFAGLIALLNAELVAAGRPTLGFLNPFLYMVAGPAGAFNDIITGSNSGFGASDDQLCDTTTSVFLNATKGWDAVTGWGTPDFARLLEAAKQAPSTSSAASSGAPTIVSPSATSQAAPQASNATQAAPANPSATSAAAAGVGSSVPTSSAPAISGTSPSSSVTSGSPSGSSAVSASKGNGVLTAGRPSTAMPLLVLAVVALFGL